MERVERLENNPIIEVSERTGDNINHPSVIQVPEWVNDPLGTYYLYFSHKRGNYIRLAYADDITGPWTVYAKGVLHIDETPFIGHIASPDVHVDHTEEIIRLYFHGETRARDLLRRPSMNGQYRKERYGFKRRELPYRLLFNTGRWVYKKFSSIERNDQTATSNERSSASGGKTAEVPPVEQWLRDRNLVPVPIQETRQAQSANGLSFQSSSSILGPSWFRVFEYQDKYYALGRNGYVYTSPSSDRTFDRSKKLFDDHRHFGVNVDRDTLEVYYSRATDIPETIIKTEVELSSDPDDWTKRGTCEVLAPERSYEGADISLEETAQRGPAQRRQELRDPYIFTEEGRSYLFYALAGESGIGVARLESE